MKGKKEGLERYKHKDNTGTCYIEEETKELDEKPLHHPPSGEMIH